MLHLAVLLLVSVFICHVKCHHLRNSLFKLSSKSIITRSTFSLLAINGNLNIHSMTKASNCRIMDGCELPSGFEGPSDNRARPKTAEPILVTSLHELKMMIKLGYRVPDLDVRGNTTENIDSSLVHPVVKALYERRDSASLGGRDDNLKIAIAIEGGGMRGCVAAGMITAVSYLGLADSVDIIYGSSAGSLVGAYFISRQLPYFGPEIYYDVLTQAGKEFIDALAILRSCGLGLLDFRLESIMRMFTDRMGKPVLNLDYLLGAIVQKIKPLDWEAFWSNQTSKRQVLKVVASGLLSKKAVVMSAEDSNFKTLEELAECMKASMSLPGVTGEVKRLKASQIPIGGNIERTWWREYNSWTESHLVLGSEPMSDAQMFEPIPYRSAEKENCTHVLVLRTRPDDLTVTPKMGIMEKMIMVRFFGRKQSMPNLVAWMNNQYHKLVYAEDMLVLNDANRDFTDARKTKLFCVAVPKGTAEVKRFETSRSVIFGSVREGFAAAYDALVIDQQMKGRGMEIAKEIWPDSILDQEPAHLLELKAKLAETQIPPPEVVVQQALESSISEDVPFSKRKALVKALKKMQLALLGDDESDAKKP